MQILSEYQLMLQTNGGKSPLTVKNYLCDIRQFVTFLEEKDIIDVTVEDVRSFLKKRQEQGETSYSLNRKLASLRSLYRWLLDEKEIIEKDPTRTIESFKVEDRRKTLKSLTQRQVARLIEVIENPRDKALCLLFASTGIRLGEAVRLNRADLDLSKRNAKLVVREGKGNTFRIVYPSGQATTALLEYLDTRFDELDALFISQRKQRLAARTIQFNFEKYFKKAGIKDATVHSLRHSFSVHRLKRGANLKELQQLLGHKSITSTQIYTELDDTHIAKVARETEIEY
jgi:site-specific recombinase XerD